MQLIHASCVAFMGRAVLITGDSGSGKSDLALRLTDRGAFLVSDDQVELMAEDGVLHASPPKTIAGKLEVRGVGIMAMPYKIGVPVVLAVKLVAREQVERLPEPETLELADIKVPLLRLHAFDSSTPAKIRLYLNSGL